MSLPTTEKIPTNFASPWKGMVTADHYTRINKWVDKLGKKKEFSSAQKYEQAKFIISNHLFLIHEYVNLGKARNGFDYDRIQKFAIKNKDLVRYLFRKQYTGFTVEAFDAWVEPQVDMLECAMYLPSNRYNKHNHH